MRFTTRNDSWGLLVLRYTVLIRAVRCSPSHNPTALDLENSKTRKFSLSDFSRGSQV